VLFELVAMTVAPAGHLGLELENAIQSFHVRTPHRRVGNRVHRPRCARGATEEPHCAAAVAAQWY
jgi:hypothetical protein